MGAASAIPGGGMGFLGGSGADAAPGDGSDAQQLSSRPGYVWAAINVRSERLVELEQDEEMTPEGDGVGTHSSPSSYGSAGAGACGVDAHEPWAAQEDGLDFWLREDALDVAMTVLDQGSEAGGIGGAGSGGGSGSSVGSSSAGPSATSSPRQSNGNPAQDTASSTGGLRKLVTSRA
jgi:hypothetical protein